MSTPLITCERGVIPREVTAQAVEEAYDLWDGLDQLQIEGVDIREHIPDSPYNAPMISVRMKTRGEYETFAKVAPTTLAILRQLGSTTMEGYEVSENFRPGGFTINYMGYGQRIPTHRDNGAGRYDNLSCIANLLGDGRFVVVDAKDEDAIVEYVDVSEGDVHMFLNAALYRDRQPHYALNTGDSTRISLGFVIPQIPISTSTSE